MKEHFKKMGFTHFNQEGFDAFVKTYTGFRLFVATVPDSGNLLASIQIGTMEISIPNYITTEWVSDFDTENISLKKQLTN